MRDPQGHVELVDQQVIRRLNRALSHTSFLRHTDAERLVNQKKLVSFVFKSETEIVSPRLPFVTYPHEWCDAQLSDAAQLTLEISKYCEPSGYELKDASSWNVIFDGVEPIFCDHLSFEKISRRNWWAFGQYVRHFIFPLYVAKYAGLNSYQSYKISRDGLAPDQVKNLIGVRRFITRYWPLMLNFKVKNFESRQQEKLEHKTKHANLYSLSKYLLDGVKPSVKKSVWSNYTGDRVHYSDTAHADKKAKIESWLDNLKPNWVADFGCNTGEFTLIANAKGSKVIALDLDHECIQKLYRSAKGNRDIYPIVVNLDDIDNGRGWAGSEFESLTTRIRRVNELTLMLALVHHLSISNSIPFKQIAKLARSVTKKWLIVELLDHLDPLVQYLCKQRDREPAEFNLKQQMAAFEQYFTIVDIHQVAGTHRKLCLLEVCVEQ